MNKKPEWFKEWLRNDWKHMNWKVNLLIVMCFSIFIAVIAKFITG